MLRGKRLAVLALGLGAAAAALIVPAIGSDHADTPENVRTPGADLTDVFVFPSKENADNVVLVMTVNPLITSSDGGNTRFDPNVLYQFKIDTNGDFVEDKVIQAKFGPKTEFQTVQISGPVNPRLTGTVSTFEGAFPTAGRFNEVFSPTEGMRVFAGRREDPFFFDLERFFEIFPDRATPLGAPAPANPNQPMQTSWRPPGQARDFFEVGRYNVLAIVVELPRSSLAAGG